MSQIKQLVFPLSRTDQAGDIGLLLLRLTLGVVFFAHGAQKLFGSFGGGGVSGTGAFFEQSGLTPGEPLAVLAGSGELVGGILLALGLMSRLGAVAVGTSMVIAIVAVHLPGPLIGGFELPLALLAAAGVVLLGGPGRLSLDRLVRERIG
jgi:putative oxidoreductase